MSQRRIEIAKTLYPKININTWNIFIISNTLTNTTPVLTGMDQSLVRRDGGIIATVGCLVVSTLCCLLCCCGRPRGGHSNDGSHGRSYRAGYRSGYTDGCFTSEIASDCM